MFDPIGLSAEAVARQTVTAPLLVFAAGIASSFGPCVAPRFVALAACTAQSSRPKLLLATFIAGLVSAYASFGIASSLFGGLHAYSSLVYLAVCLGLLAGGIVTIVRAEHDDHLSSDSALRQRSLGAVFFLGASFAFVISPCCTPLVAMILAYTSLVGRRAYGAALLAAFALGHAFPLLVYGSASMRISQHVRRVALSQAVVLTSGTLMIGLAGYYALLV
jgi:cytochrome c-type biogenesis protein